MQVNEQYLYAEVTTVTRKDYEAIAKALRDARRAITDKEPAESLNDLWDGVGYARDYICDMLAADNPNFDRARFLAACR